MKAVAGIHEVALPVETEEEVLEGAEVAAQVAGDPTATRAPAARR